MHFREKWDAASIFELANLFKLSEVLFAAVELDLFTHIQEPITVEEMSRLLKLESESLEVMLVFLEKTGLVCSDNRAYYVHPEAAPYLVSHSAASLRKMIQLECHVRNQGKMNQQLVRIVRRDRCTQEQVNITDSNMITEALEISHFSSFQLIRKVRKYMQDIHQPRLLDLGSGPGTISASFCKVFDDLRAVLVDRREVLEYAREQLKQKEISDRVEFLALDFMKDRIDGEYDVVVMSNICHFYSKAELANLFTVIRSNVSADGIIIVHDFFFDESKDSLKHSDYFAIDWMVNHGVKFYYSLNEMEQFMESYGLKTVEKSSLSRLPTSYLIARVQ